MYIVIEGNHGSGKSVRARKLAEFLQKKYSKRKVLLTFEPGGGEVANAIRKCVQATKYNEKVEGITEAYLYAASRAQTLRTIVQPCLEKGGIVISDRSVVSSLAIQGVSRGLGLDTVMQINRLALADFLPNIVIYLHLDYKRAKKRTFDAEGDRLEKENMKFFRKVERGYLEVSQMPLFKRKWVDIDASGSVEEVFDRIQTTLEPRIAKNIL